LHSTCKRIWRRRRKKGKQVNFGALYRKAIEEDWGTEYQAKQKREAEKLLAQNKQKATIANESQTKRLEELKAEFQRTATYAAVKALTFEDRQKHAEAFIAEVGQGRAQSYNPEKADFADTVERAKFNNALRQRLAPAFDPIAFTEWLRLEKKVNSTSLGGMP
jgi:hypothetical protein